jgi:hypothetical protein
MIRDSSRSDAPSVDKSRSRCSNRSSRSTASLRSSRSITPPVHEVMRRKARSNFQWFKRCRSQPFNGSIVQQFKRRSQRGSFTFEDFRSVEGQDRLEVQLATSSLMWIPRIPDSIWLRLLLGTSAARCRLAVNYCRCSKPCPVSPAPTA